MPTTFAMRVRPPKITRPVRTAMTSPVYQGSALSDVLSESAMVLDWTLLKMRP